MKAKLTAKDLYYSERCEKYRELTPGQQSAFRGLVTWLAHNTAPDAEDAQYIGYICEMIGTPPVQCTGGTSLASAIGAGVKQLMAPVYKLLMVKDSVVASTCPRKIKSPADVAELAMAYSKGLDREHLIVIMLDTKNSVIGINTVTVGSLNAATVCMRELFKPAIIANSASIIVSHNHPSGDPTPSPEDVSVTRMIVEAGKLLAIDVLDHIVCGEDRWVSLKERGLGF